MLVNYISTVPVAPMTTLNHFVEWGGLIRVKGITYSYCRLLHNPKCLAIMEELLPATVVTNQAQIQWAKGEPVDVERP